MAKKKIETKIKLRESLFKEIPPEDRADSPTFSNSKDNDIYAKHALEAIKNIKGKDIKPVLPQVINLTADFAENDRQVYNDLMADYDKIVASFQGGTEIEQIKLLSRYHQFRKFTGWLLGDMLLWKRELIERTRRRGGEYNSISQFVEKNEEFLGFGVSAANKYILIRETVTLEQFKRLGVNKSAAVAGIRNEKEKAKIINKIMDKPETSVKDVREMVADYQYQERQKAATEKKEKRQEIIKTVTYDVTVKNGKITITPNDPDMTTHILDAIHHFDLQIKAFVKKAIEG